MPNLYNVVLVATWLLQAPDGSEGKIILVLEGFSNIQLDRLFYEASSQLLDTM